VAGSDRRENQSLKEELMQINFFRAEMDNLEVLLSLVEEYYAFDQHPFEQQRMRTLLTEVLEDASCGYLWLIQQQAQAIGYVFLTLGSYSLEYGGRDAFIDEFYLRRPFRGRGFGRQTIQFLLQTCAELGVKALHLEVERQNLAAQSFYRQVGFRDQDRYLMTQNIPADFFDTDTIRS
jgi:diamine N-acetyltransferase